MAEDTISSADVLVEPVVKNALTSQDGTTNLTNYLINSVHNVLFPAFSALELKGIDYDYKPIHLVKNGGEQHTNEYQKVNPMGQV